MKEKIKNLVNKLTSKVGDKNMHIICSFLITILFGQIGILVGAIAGCVAGLAKEAYDEYKYKKLGEGVGLDKENLYYDVLGVAIAIIVLIL